jgi:hypothetical protein
MAPRPIESKISNHVRIAVNAVTSGEQQAEVLVEVVKTAKVNNLRVAACKARLTIGSVQRKNSRKRLTKSKR